MQLLVLAFCLFVVSSYAQQKQQPIPSIIQGEWNLQISTQKLVDNKLTAGDEAHTYLNVSEVNNKLSATYTDWERELHFKISVDWLSVNSGELRIAEIKVEEEVDPVEESEGQEFVGKSDMVQTGKEELLFAFEFVNRTNGYLFATGEFNGVNGKHVGTYNIVIPSPQGFIMTIIAKDGSEVITITGSKPQLPGEQSIFQRLMGSPIAMVAVFMMLRTFLSRQTAGALAPAAAAKPAAAAPGAAKNATGAAPKGGRKDATAPRNGPVVEDVSDKSD